MLSVLLLTALQRGQQAPYLIGLAELHRLDLLPAFKRSTSIGNVSSYDRTGGNDDGFSGKYSYIRKEGDTLVLADIKGPGCIYRIHTPTPSDNIVDITFDGESKPRISCPFSKLFTDHKAPFVQPLVDVAGGGYYCYVPMPFQKSCKIAVHAKMFQFYDLNYATYPADAPIKTFDPQKAAADWQDIQKIKTVFEGGRTADLTAFNLPSGANVHKHTFDAALPAGKSVVLFEAKRGGRIGSFRVGPATAFEGKNRDILLKITWDDAKKPAVLCPAGDFFGYAWGNPASGDCLVGTSGDVDYCNLPMPFDHAAKVELVSLRSSGAPVQVRGEVVVGDAPRKAYEGKFYAVWRRENPTTEGKSFTFLETKGRGHIVGLALQAQGKESGNTEFFEGDDETTIDGSLVIHGTGSEDFFNGGWYDVPDRWDRRMARPLSGCMEYQKPLGRTGAYRFFIGDAYSFRKSILQTIEHAGEGNRHPADYCGVTYLYCENPPTVDMSIPDLAQRKVVDPKKIVFTADWTVPIASFSFRDATLSRTSVPAGAHRERCLSLRTNGDDYFGPAFISLVCDLPEAANYKISIDAVKGPEQGVVQLFRDELPIGRPIDLYSDKPSLSTGIDMGVIPATEGPNHLMFKIVDKNGKSKSYGFDLVHIVCEKTG